MTPRTLLHRLRPQDGLQRLFVGIILLLQIGGVLYTLYGERAWLLPAVLGTGLLLAIVEWRLLYYLLMFTLAFSQEISLPSGLSMDVPSEPLLLALTACVGGALVLGFQRLPWRELLHPLLVILALMLLWSALDITFSVNTTKSVKYVLAKVWYLVPFVLGTLVVVRRPAEVWYLLGTYVAGAALSAAYVLARHATRWLSFDSINWAVLPFYHNHVIYATVLALLVPFAWLGAQTVPPGPWRRLWKVALWLLLAGLFSSYTRASMLALPVAWLYARYVLRPRRTWVLLLALMLGTGGVVGYLAHDSNFMRFTPDFEKTTFNGHSFAKHLEATYKLQDASGIERLYRWVAAAHMVADKPLVGSGPATFYPEYKRYTVKGFRTYVSANPEKSTTHNYFLLQLAEQGVLGFALFVLLLGTALLMAEHLYHRAAAQPEVQRVVLAVVLSLVIIIFHLTLNELVEVDKIGSVFFICLALLVRSGSWLAEGEAAAAPGALPAPTIG